MNVAGSQQFDVIVVGGGPSGCTVATLVAMQGHKVLLLERERHPRYQIGESLLPTTIHYICVLLGVRDEVAKAGFTRKIGGRLIWGQNQEMWGFEFGLSPAFAGENAYSYQVRRAEFDKILLDNARRKGVDVREEHSVIDAISEDGRVVGVRFTDEAGREGVARARFVVDASGNQSRLADKVGTREYSKYFQNIAMFAYWEGGRRLPEPHEGSILVEAFKEGWFWYIPLAPNLTSVGAVVAREHADKLKQAPEQAMKSLIDQTRLVKEYLGSTPRVTEGPYGQHRIRKDWSYSHSRFWIPGLVLVGDCACFVDPILSSGVHLATYSALLAARSINTSLKNALPEERCFREYEMRYRREYSNFYQFLIAFYDRHKDEQSYFWKARSVLQVQEASNEAFVRLVSGVSNNGEPVYSTADEVFQAKAHVWDVGDKIKAKMQATIESGAPPTAIVPLVDEFVDTFTAFTHPPEASPRKLGIVHAGNEVSRQLFEGGLVPTQDELHWCEA